MEFIPVSTIDNTS